mmetsp:Transcript_66588/g.135571  ORF Transcript_66588/g.135571 Transcript_66588/m.135571 type:complete len:80 (-) Transcript_66588:295-534(-)
MVADQLVNDPSPFCSCQRFRKNKNEQTNAQNESDAQHREFTAASSTNRKEYHHNWYVHRKSNNTKQNENENRTQQNETN